MFFSRMFVVKSWIYSKILLLRRWMLLRTWSYYSETNGSRKKRMMWELRLPTE